MPLGADRRSVVSALTALLTASIVVGGCMAAPGGRGDASPTTTTEPTHAPPPSSPAAVEAVEQFRSVRRVDVVAPPNRVTIPAIGVSTELEHLRRNPDGTVEVPQSWDRAGWYSEGSRPGQPGPAVILGHVDSKDGPAVFYRLEELRPNDDVVVDRADGSRVRFRVDRVERHPKDRFPTDAVYLPVLEPALRLVTCGGSFDGSTGHYRDNIIAFASLAA